MSFDTKKPFVPDPTGVFGPGVEHWRVVRENNHFAKSDEKVLRGRADVRRRFVAGFESVVQDLMRTSPADGEGK